MTSPEPHPLIVEAMKKAAVAWLTVGELPAAAAWLSWQDGAAYLVHDGSEQPIAGLADAQECAVSVRGEHGGRILTWPASVQRVAPQTPEWDAIAPQLARNRLNASDPIGAPARWASGARISRLIPTGAPIEAGDTLPDAAAAAPPRPTPATTHTPIPRTIGRRRR